MALDISEYGVPDRQLAELPRKGEMLFVVQRLAAEEHHFPFEKRRADFRDCLRAKGLGQIDTVDIGADMKGMRPHFDGHFQHLII